MSQAAIAKQNEELPPLPAPSFTCKPGDYGLQLRAIHRAVTELENEYKLRVLQNPNEVDPATGKPMSLVYANHLHALEVAMTETMFWVSKHADDLDALKREVARREQQTMSAKELA